MRFSRQAEPGQGLACVRVCHGLGRGGGDGETQIRKRLARCVAIGHKEAEMVEGEGMPLKDAMHEMPGGEMMADSEMAEKPEGESKITPELLEMLLAKLGK